MNWISAEERLPSEEDAWDGNTILILTDLFEVYVAVFSAGFDKTGRLPTLTTCRYCSYVSIRFDLSESQGQWVKATHWCSIPPRSTVWNFRTVQQERTQPSKP